MSDTLHPPADDAAAAASAASVAEIYAALAPERLEADEAAAAGPSVSDEVLRAQWVDVLLVCHNGAAWLPRVLAALSATDVLVGSVTAVDTGSTDGTADLLAQAPLVDTVVPMAEGSGFAAALSAAVARVASGPMQDVTRWYWVLHDDSAPHPDTLRRLLVGALAHEAAVAGPKVLSWDRRRQLVEMGVSITGSGRRSTGLERREYDQGQHDDRRDVLAVGSAGMLVRADAWHALDGLDPAISIFRDDVDFGWRAHRAGYRVVVVPDAVIEHAEAAAHGRRVGAALTRHPHITDRANALYVLLANAGPLGLLVGVPRAVLGSLLRAVGFVLGKVPGLAYDELVALRSALSPSRLRAGRRWRRSQPRGGSLAGLRPTAGHQARQAVDNLTGLLAGTGAGQDVPGARRRAVPGIPDIEEEDEPLPTGESLLVRALTTPGVLLVVGTGLLALLASRGLLGPGRLLGGALLPAPAGASDLWATYLAGWHPVGLGSGEGAPPYLAALALGSLPLLGSVSALVTVLLLLSVPLASLSAWRATRGLVASGPLRAWGALTYGVVLLASGAVPAGRLGTCVAAVLAPGLARAVVRALAPAAPWRLAWSAGFLLAVTTAFAPVVWPVTVVAAGVLALVLAPRPGAAGRWAAVAGTPLVVLLPWTLTWVQRPATLVMEPGRTGSGAELAAAALPSWAPLLLHPGGPGSLPAGLLVGVPLLALLAWAVPAARRGVALAWVLALAAMAAAVVTSRVAVSAPPEEGVAAAWPGPSVLLVALGLLAAVLLAGDARRQPRRRGGPGPAPSGRPALMALAAVVAVATVLVPALVGFGRGQADPLARAEPEVLPVYVAQEAAGPERPGTLVLRLSEQGDADRVTYSLLRADPPALGDADVGSLTEPSLTALVGDLLAVRGGAGAGDLATYGVRYVFVPAPADPRLVESVDGQAGLLRASAPEGGALWRVDGTTARVRLLTPDERVDQPVGVVVPSGPVTVDAAIDTAEADRLVLAERPDAGWRATLDGEPLAQVEGQDVLTFALPSGTGQLQVTYDDPVRRWLVVGQGVALLVLVLAMLPSLRRRADELEDAVELDDGQGRA